MGVKLGPALNFMQSMVWQGTLDCNATLCTELTRIQDGGYTAVDPTSPGYLKCIEVLRHDAYLELCTGGMRMQVGL